MKRLLIVALLGLQNPYAPPATNNQWVIVDWQDSSFVSIRLPNGLTSTIPTDGMLVTVRLPNGAVKTYTAKQIKEVIK